MVSQHDWIFFVRCANWRMATQLTKACTQTYIDSCGVLIHNCEIHFNIVISFMTRYPKRSHFKRKVLLNLNKRRCVLHVPLISFLSFDGPKILYSQHKKAPHYLIFPSLLLLPLKSRQNLLKFSAWKAKLDDRINYANKQSFCSPVIRIFLIFGS